MDEALQRHGAIGVLLDDQSRFLVIRRSLTVRAPGRLCFPGGSVENGETHEQAVVRELREELAISVAPIRKIWENETPSGVRLHWWRVEMNVGEVPTPNPEEVAECFWMTAAELAKDPGTLSTNLEFLRRLEQEDFEL